MIIWTSWITYVVIFIALVLLFIYEYKRRAEYMKEPEPVYQPPTTAFEIFLRRVGALKGLRLEDQQDFKIYYSELTGGTALLPRRHPALRCAGEDVQRVA